MTVLLDTCVVSDLRRAHRYPRLQEWISWIPVDEIVIPAIAIAEIRRGIARLLQLGDHSGATATDHWLNGLMLAFEIASFDADAAVAYGLLAASTRHDGSPSFERDLMIASTAAAHGFVVATRNVRHFRQMVMICPELALLNPYDSDAMPRQITARRSWIH